eukprot:1195266-Prorocentrum_minimum.AAC.1
MGHQHGKNRAELNSPVVKGLIKSFVSVSSPSLGFLLGFGSQAPSLGLQAAIAALEEDLEAPHVSARHFDIALGRVPSSIPPESEAFYTSFLRTGTS